MHVFRVSASSCLQAGGRICRVVSPVVRCVASLDEAGSNIRNDIAVGLSAARDARVPEVLWAPGDKADEYRTKRFAGKIGLLCRSGKGRDNVRSPCTLGSRGAGPTARTMRAIASTSEAEKAPVEFKVRWHEDLDAGRSLRFRVGILGDWGAFHRKWATYSEGIAKPLQVTPGMQVSGLAEAIAAETKRQGCAALALNASNDAVLSVAAKALATLPALPPRHWSPSGGSKEQTVNVEDLVCVLRWPQSRGGTRIYAHVLPSASKADAHIG